MRTNVQVLRKDVNPDKDLIFASEPVWKYLHLRYKGEEIKRYAVTKNPAGILDRQPQVPVVYFTIMIRDEEIRQPKYLAVPRKTKIGSIKQLLKENFMWL